MTRKKHQGRRVSLFDDRGFVWRGTLAVFKKDNPGVLEKQDAAKLARGKCVLLGGGAAPLYRLCPTRKRRKRRATDRPGR